MTPDRPAGAVAGGAGASAAPAARRRFRALVFRGWGEVSGRAEATVDDPAACRPGCTLAVAPRRGALLTARLIAPGG